MNLSSPEPECGKTTTLDLLATIGKNQTSTLSAIRSRGNKETELKLVSILRAARITGWRRHHPVLGCPDFVFLRELLAIFVDGCFWHGCRWHCRMPQDNGPYWQRKISRNLARNRAITITLRSSGWRVLRVWAHALHHPGTVVRRITSELKGAVRQYNNTPTSKN